MKDLFRHIFIVLIFFSGLKESSAREFPAFVKYITDPWVDSTLNKMTIDQKIGQLFIVQVYSTGSNPPESLLSEIRNFQIGGILFMKGNAINQVLITNELQKQSKIPLLITMDAEWGPAFRLSNTPRYPVQMALGTITRDTTLIYEMGTEIGLQLRRLGVHVNFAPVTDVNNNPENPVINYRSFGEDPLNVSKRAWLYARGMQDSGVLAVAKHFPGHGDTRIDSHLNLPVINQDRPRLDSVELYPFSQIIDKGIGGIMTAHLQVPALESNPKLSASLSPNVIKDLLIRRYGFQGLVVTDAMNMQGVSKKYSPDESAVMALRAGNDMLEVVPDLGQAIEAVKKAVQKGKISKDEIEWKCRKILALKRWLNLNNYQTKDTANLEFELNQPRYRLTERLLHERSLTLLRNKNQLLPLQRLDTLNTAVISIGTEAETDFQRMTANYMETDFFYLRKNATLQEINKLITQLRPYNLLICDIQSLELSPIRNYGTDPSITDFIQQTGPKKKIFVLEGNPYALNNIPGIEKSDALLVTYQKNKITQELAAQAVFGALNVNGRLPVNVNSFFKIHDGVDIKSIGRLKFTLPEETGISSTYLEHKIDSLAELGLKSKAYPGCQALIARYGKVIFHKCYGYHTYKNDKPVEPADLYDWASVTKIAGPLPALIKLYSEKKLKLDVPFSNYWPDFKGTDKKNITLRQLLAHQGRLRPGIPFWSEALLSNGKPDPEVFSDHPGEQYNIRISANMYMNKNNVAKMYEMIRDSKLLPTTAYSYSDLAFFLFPKVIENLTGENYESYLKNEFYSPLGASTISYNPYRFFPISQFVPTEEDDFFRHELVDGFVHDEGAAMFGGVSGNAGLFGTTLDLAKVMQMYLQNGYYGGQLLLDSASLAEFTKVQFPEKKNRRGLGFDKPFINNYLYRPTNAYPASGASQESYGHSGFTGTFTWVDPKKQIVFVFMSNRIFPTRNNPRLNDLRIRSEMLQSIYDSIKRGLTIY